MLSPNSHRSTVHAHHGRGDGGGGIGSNKQQLNVCCTLSVYTHIVTKSPMLSLLMLLLTPQIHDDRTSKNRKKEREYQVTLQLSPVFSSFSLLRLKTLSMSVCCVVSRWKHRPFRRKMCTHSSRSCTDSKSRLLHLMHFAVSVVRWSVQCRRCNALCMQPLFAPQDS